ncbi:hypothetical protein GEV33_003874 [Tenebrio molitor]|uniref:CCHC-type domain-containing protein n=1 Tax=Tenebrio molitor TaxID=7067 RepID=A0A8J6LN96_TENMO|nr:hypothetical protein GEV33_003874 [Tenebrio molitor]
MSRVFLNCGIDYAGLIHIKEGRGRGKRSVKAYIAIFVCFVTRATHSELESDCTAEAFINAYVSISLASARRATWWADRPSPVLTSEDYRRPSPSANRETTRKIGEERHYSYEYLLEFSERYATWKFRISALLEELNVAVVVAQEVPAVPTEEWKKKNSLARNTIIEYLGDSLLGFAKEQEFAKQIIANLDTIYERRSLATQLTLRKKLLNLKTKPNENLQVHFTRFDDLVTELLAAGAKLDEMDKISHLLLTLPSVYDGVITALETLSEDNLNLAFVKTRLLDYEIKSRTDELTVKALETIGHSPPKNDYKKTRGRRYNPAPKQNKQYLSSKTKGRRTSYKKQSEIRCFHCGRNNHIQKDCFYYKRMIEAPKSAQQTTQAKAQATTSSFAFMMGHHMNNTTLGREEKFIIDSGATDHICNNLSLFESCTDLSTPVQIAVAKLGTSVTATKRGTIKVTTTQGMEGQLEDVLYAPDVQHNLISVPRIQAKGMTVIFSPQGVTIKNGKQTILTD